MPLDPRRVLIFREVVAAGSISSGARALGWTQPAVTQHIQALERSVGMPLILRHATGVRPTEAGRALLVHADAICSHLEAASSELEEMLLCQAGTVRLAGFPSALATLIPRAMKHMTESGSSIHVRLTEAEPDEALTMLHDDEVDLAVIFTYRENTNPDREKTWENALPDRENASSDLAGGFQRTRITTDPVALILPPSHPLASKPDLKLADLAHEEWVAGCPRCREHLVWLAHQAGFEPRISHETDDYVVVQSLVAQGLAVSVLPHVALDAFRRPDVVVRDEPELTGRTIEALYRPGAERVPSVALTLDALTRV